MSQFNKDELEAPKWLDQTFFEEVLQSYTKDPSVVVKDFQIKPGTNAGDHFASVMFKVTVNHTSEKNGLAASEIKLIMKLMPSAEGLKKEMLKETPAFKSETRMYVEVLPKMESVLEDAGIKITFGPP